nr:MAG TPA: hypothetical protein [Caudoviricetes sp.]
MKRFCWELIRRIIVRPAGFVNPLEAPKIGYSRKISHKT